MKILFASDIHGSYGDMSVLLDRIFDEKPDFVIFLGDFCGYGENLIFGELFGQMRAPYAYVKGNCDGRETLRMHGIPDNTLTCVEKYGDRNVFATHGHIYSPYNLPVGMRDGDIFVSGHTHYPTFYVKDGINILNPGSMARPRGTDKKTYAVIEGNKVRIKDSEGNTIQEENLV